MKDPHLAKQARLVPTYRAARFALLYSLLFPGLGQVYLGERAKGWTLVCMGVGAVVSIVMSPGLIARLLLGGIYLAVMVPAALDAFRTACGKPRTFPGESVPYVITMLIVIGPFAVPLLWQSGRFSRTVKVLWTIVVVLIAFVAMVFTAFAASFFEQFMGPA